jgi:hypothetical protein
MRLHYFLPALILFAISLSSCSSPRLTKVYYNDNTLTYEIMIPKGYEREIVKTGSEYVEYRYKYPDRSVIYVTSHPQGPSNINHNEVTAMKDSLGVGALAVGACLDGLCWKDRTLEGGITIGYAKVPTDKKDQYDKALESIELQESNTPETNK